MFNIQYITTYTCICGYILYRFQKVLDLPLLFPANKNNLTLLEILEYNFRPEIVEFASKWVNCSKIIIRHKKEIKLSIVPVILIISLQRFDKIKNKKNNSLVSIPNKINIKQFIENDLIIEDDIYYELFGVINHEGALDFGHYYSFIKLQSNNKWYIYNDNLVE